MINTDLKVYQIKAIKRVKTVKEGAEILELFFEIGKLSKREIYLELCIAHPDYNSVAGANQFKLFWECKIFNRELILDLHKTLDKINER